MMQYRIIFLATMMALSQTALLAQVQVSKEPRHRPVIENKYFRLLDVVVPPGDTTQFHIHSTPSLFMYLSDSKTGWQEKGGKWVADSAKTGKVWYRSFTPDSLVHRVCNTDSVVMHVTDIELLSPYAADFTTGPLPFAIEFENEKAIAYRLAASDLAGQVFQGRGPIIAILASGSTVSFHDVPSDEQTKLSPGQYIFIRPGTVFSLQADSDRPTNLVLFEIK